MPNNWTDTLARRRSGRSRSWTTVLADRRSAPLDRVDWRAVAEAAGVTKTAINRWAQARAGQLGEPRPLKIEDASEAVRLDTATHFGAV